MAEKKAVKLQLLDEDDDAPKVTIFVEIDDEGDACIYASSKAASDSMIAYIDSATGKLMLLSDFKITGLKYDAKGYIQIERVG